MHARQNHRGKQDRVLMAGYGALLGLGLLVSSPWWLLRMATTSRYREGLRERLGEVPARLRQAVAGRRVVWFHAVSVGEVLAISRLVHELERSLNDSGSIEDGSAEGSADDSARGDAPQRAGVAPWKVVISTTTRTGQALARERFGADRVFYFPLDFGWAVRAYLQALQPALVVLAESELWPRMLFQCAKADVPVAVVNARSSDRSFYRASQVRTLWARVLRMVTLWLVQSESDGQRLRILGAEAAAVQVVGNLKYDVRAPLLNTMRDGLRPLLEETDLVVAGSTLEGEEEILLKVLPELLRTLPRLALLIAPRHPERFERVLGAMRTSGQPTLRCSDLLRSRETVWGGTVLLLDTVGDLAAIYSLAAVAFAGGSLVPAGGHSPLEPAQFAVPVMMGPSFENFRDVVSSMVSSRAIRIVKDEFELVSATRDLLTRREEAEAMGERGRAVYLREGGATARTVEALRTLISTRGDVGVTGTGVMRRGWNEVGRRAGKQVKA